MSDYTHLKPGLHWARQKMGLLDTKRSAWCTIEITGRFPFLKAEIIYETDGPVSYESPENPDAWDYGPKIEVPDK